MYKLTKENSIIDVKNLLLKKNNLKTILNMENAISEAKVEVQCRFWETLLTQLLPYYPFSFYNTHNQTLKNTVRAYYFEETEKRYGLEYKVDLNFYFFIELKEEISYGFYFLDKEEKEEKQIAFLESLEIDWSQSLDRIYFKYPKKPLNFKEFNHQNIFDLIDKKSREEGLVEMTEEIIGLIYEYEAKSLSLVC